jgi:hypothetical protein
LVARKRAFELARVLQARFQPREASEELADPAWMFVAAFSSTAANWRQSRLLADVRHHRQRIGAELVKLHRTNAIKGGAGRFSASNYTFMRICG